MQSLRGTMLAIPIARKDLNTNAMCASCILHYVRLEREGKERSGLMFAAL